MRRIVHKHETFPTKFETQERSLSRAGARGDVYQQLSGKAAATILGRVVALFPDKEYPEPEDMLDRRPDACCAARDCRARKSRRCRTSRKSGSTA